MNAKIVFVLAALAAVQASPFTSLFNIPGQVMDSTSKALTSMAKGDISSTIDNFAKIPIEATQAAGKAVGRENEFKFGTDLASNIVNTVSSSFPGSGSNGLSLPDTSKLNLPTGGFSLGNFMDIPKTTMGKVGDALNSFSTADPSKIMQAFAQIPIATADSVGKSFGMEKQFSFGTDLAKKIVSGVSTQMNAFNPLGNIKDLTKNFGEMDFLSGEKSPLSGLTDFAKNFGGMNFLSGEKSPLSGITNQISGAKDQLKGIFGGVLNQDELQKVLAGKIPDVNGLKDKLQGIANVDQLTGKITDAVQNLGQFDVQAIRENAGNVANEILSNLQQIPIDPSQLGQMQQKVIDLARQIQTTTNAEEFAQLTSQVQEIKQQVQQQVSQTLKQVVGTFNQQFEEAMPQIQAKLDSIRDKINPEQFAQLQEAVGETFQTIQHNISKVADAEQLQQLQAFAEGRFGEITDVISQLASQ